MKLSKVFSAVVKIIILVLPLVSFASVGAPFAVKGEQLDHMPPKGWKLAWMDGKPDGRYIAEYIPEKEDINSWREGYLAIERLPYPSSEAIKEIEKTNTKLSSLALRAFMEKVASTCGGKHFPMSQRTNTFNGVPFAVGGGYCDKYGPAAPFGEGSFVSFAEGKSYLFRIQYSWRPISADDKSNLSWRIVPETAKQYLEAIKASSLCGGVDQPSCRNVYAPR